MSTTHTPGPWRVEYKHTGTYIFSNEPNCLLLSMSHTRSTKECNDNAVRIVKCVNAMEGIPDPSNLRATWDAIQHLDLDKYKNLKEAVQSLIQGIDNGMHMKSECDSLGISISKLCSNQ